MLLLQVVLINTLALVLMAGIGWLPARLLWTKAGIRHGGFRLFASVFLGYMLSQSLVAIWVTRGLSMQWLNFLPFLILYGMPAEKHAEPLARYDYRRDLIIVGSLVLICSLYFVRSYSHDFVHIDRYPFIDLVSYAASAYGMGQSGAEVYFSDMALYYPGLSRLDLYHFTELWFVRMISAISGQTELWVVCFILPVFSLGILITGLISLPETRRLPGSLLFLLIFSFCFAFGKLLFFNDSFLFHVLDLFGQKISIIIPALLLLWNLRGNRLIFLALILLLPQINILLGIPLAVFAVAGFFFWPEQKFRLPVLKIWLLYGLYAGLFLGLYFLGKGQSSGSLELMPFSMVKAVSTFFQYGREALYNLGFFYWLPFLSLAALFRSRVYTLLLIPFFAGKLLGKLLPQISSSLLAAVPACEFILAVSGLWWLNRRFFRFPPIAGYLILMIFFLCAVGAAGYAISGFMDFEQIYTLLSCSIFFLFAFALFLLPEPERYPPLLRFRNNDWLLGILLLALVFKTVRFQRVLPFDLAFYDQVRREAGTVSRSVFFTSKRYAPFPLHVKAGFPMLFYFPDAHSTPVTQFEDSSWHGKNIAWHVMQFPFYYFATRPENEAFSRQENSLKFIRKNNIRFAWVDDAYPQSRLDFLKPYTERIWHSGTDKQALWKLKPEAIPLANGHPHLPESKVDSGR